MQSWKKIVRIVAALIPVAYCFGLVLYFSNMGGSPEGLAGIGLGPTVLGLGAIGLLLCIPLLYRILRAVTGSGRAKADQESGADAGAAVLESEPGFDADAALARYMAKKESGLVEAPPVEAAIRPAFGRKGL
jgi:hypothetical protein